MAALLVQSEYTYRSGSAPNLYSFTIVSDQQGLVSVRDIQDPYGFILSPYTQIPKSVSDDINSAMGQVENILSLSSAVNGILTFTEEYEKHIIFATPFANDTYRVQVSSDVFAPFRIVNKTNAGFTIQAGATISGKVGYDVFV